MARITFISRMTVKPGKEAEFIALCRDMEDYVRANEPDTLIFGFYRLREPQRFAVLESFPNEAAEHAHMTSAKLAAAAPAISACLDGTWEREYLDDL